MQTRNKLLAVLIVITLLLPSVSNSLAQADPTTPEVKENHLYLPLVSVAHEVTAAQDDQANATNEADLAASQARGQKQKDNPQPVVIEQTPPDLPNLGIVYAGLQRNLNGPCGQLYQIKGSALCSHGPDLPPPGFTVSATTPQIAANDQAKLALPAICDGDGTSGNRTQVMYVRATDRADRFSQYLSSIRQWAAEMDQIYYDSAAETGGARRVRFVHDANCVLTVLNVVISTTGDDTFSNTMNELAALGYNRADRKYAMFMDANIYCGIGSVWGDDQFGQSNANNFGPSYSRADNGCWSGFVISHELMHNLGGVQLSAPHTSGGYHCVDEYDVMCYSDSPNYPTMQYLCPDSAHENRFDCNHDDYYHTSPPAGSYLATHWNAANSRFLIALQNGISPPSNLQAVAASGAQINLTWADNASNETGYKIERCQGASCTNFAQIATVGANVATYANTGLTAGTTYFYRVRATNATGDSAYSNTATGTTPYPGCTIYNSTDVPKNILDNTTIVSTLAAPVNKTLTDVNLLNLRINHTYDADLSASLVSPAGTVVTLFSGVGSSGDNFDNTRLDDAAATLITSGSAPFSDAYRPASALSALNGQNGNGTWSLRITDGATGDVGALTNWAVELCGATVTPPAAPSNLQAVAASGAQINLTWVDNASNETGFKIERCQGAGCTNFAQIATVGANVLTYANTGLTAGSTYLYRVRATNTTGDSAYSNTATATTTGPLPAAPSNLQAVAASSSLINLTWTDNANNETGFKIERCQGASCTSFTEFGAVAPNENAVSDSGLASGVTYCYRIRAYNDNGDSAWSNTGCAATPAPTNALAAPSSLRAVATSPTQINLTWTDNSTAEIGVKIERCQGVSCSTFAQTAVVGRNVIKYINTRLTANVTYCYRVRAYNATTNTAYSNTACVATPATALLSQDSDAAFVASEVEDNVTSENQSVSEVENDSSSNEQNVEAPMQSEEVTIPETVHLFFPVITH